MTLQVDTQGVNNITFLQGKFSSPFSVKVFIANLHLPPLHIAIFIYKLNFFYFHVMILNNAVRFGLLAGTLKIRFRG